jgi:hypothetical protein
MVVLPHVMKCCCWSTFRHVSSLSPLTLFFPNSCPSLAPLSARHIAWHLNSMSHSTQIVSAPPTLWRGQQRSPLSILKKTS